MFNNPVSEDEWVSIPAGEFIMGSPEDEVDHEEDEIEHNVSIEAFEMMRFTITFKQYDEYCKQVELELNKDEGWGRDKHPVLFVNWFEARKFAEWLSKHTQIEHRLPTEAEWEYACRADTDTAFSFGDEICDQDANYDGTHAYDDGETGIARGKTLPVGQFAANPWGLFDMHGNVWEWTNSVYDSDYQGAETESAQENTFGPRVVRGGSWFHFVNNVRSAYRGRGYPNTSLNSFGFRLIRKKS